MPTTQILGGEGEEQMGTPPGGNYQTMAVATQGSGSGLCLFSLDGDGLLWCVTQPGASGPWNAPQGPKFGGQQVPGSQIALADQGNGLLLLAMLDAEGKTWTLAQTAPGTWGDWTAPPIGAQIISFSSIAAATSYSFGLQLMAADDMGQIWSCYQLSPGGEWGGWVALGAGTQPFDAYELALGGQNNDQLMLVAEGGGQLATCVEDGTGPAWGPWSNADVNGQSVPLREICACQQSGTRGILVCALDDNGQIWTLYQETSGGQWAPWQGPGFASQPEPFVTIAAALQNDGCCLLIGVGEDGNPWTIPQTSPGGDWGAWSQPL